MESDGVPPTSSSQCGSAKDLFSAHQQEIQRRKNDCSVAEDDLNVQQFQNFQPQDQGKGPQTLKIPDQLFVLYSMSTAAFAPFRGHDATSSGLRVYGTFPTRDEALHHADVISGEDNCVSLFISSSATWFLLSDDEVSVQNSELF